MRSLPSPQPLRLYPAPSRPSTHRQPQACFLLMDSTAAHPEYMHSRAIIRSSTPRPPPEQVRALAAAADLPNKARKDSQGICFLGKVKFSEFIR